MNHIVKSAMLRSIGNGVCSQVVELVMVEVDPAAQLGGPPSPVQKALADWEFSEQQAEPRSPSQMVSRGLSLKKRQNP